LERPRPELFLRTGVRWLGEASSGVVAVDEFAVDDCRRKLGG
jgi:hypothetical protein